MDFRKIFLGGCGLLLLVSQPGWSQTTLNDVVRKAIFENPEVQARWYDLQVVGFERDGVRGGYYPRLDLTAGAGWEHYGLPDTPSSSKHFNPREATITLTQMLYDGFATRNELRKMDYAHLTRYYEVVEAAENTALEAARAYLDVLRYRKLIALSEENYEKHRDVFTKVQQQTNAGISRGVDLEQAKGRLSLALSNRLTEYSNLHDVSAHYARIVGELPAPDLAEPELLTPGIPADANAAQILGARSSPALRAAIANADAMYASRDRHKAPFRPRLDFRAWHSLGRDRAPIEGRSDETVAEVVLTMNLFRGGADRATLNQAQQLISRALYQREKACRNMRQVVGIAYNDIENLQETLEYLDGHQMAMGKALEAYRDQFESGRRTLLDLLDSENEYFESQRAYVIAEYDYALAPLRVLAAMGQLLQTLEVQSSDMPTLADLRFGEEQIDPLTICPPAAVSDSIQ